MTATELHGVLDGLAESDYFAHPALSASGAKKLLPPSCPAIYKYERDHGQAPRREFDFGHAAHAEVLGVGGEIVAIDADSWRTKAAKEAADAARAEGKIPLLAEEVTRVKGMAEALRLHPIAAALLDPGSGDPEQSLFWTDEQTGVPCRSRVDFLRRPVDDRLILVDYKSALSAQPGAIGKAVANYGYHLSGAFYRRGIRTLGLAEDVPVVLIFQEKTAPYVVTVVELDDEAMRVGEQLTDRALQVFAECTATDTWPPYSTDIELISLPRWATYGLEAA